MASNISIADMKTQFTIELAIAKSHKVALDRFMLWMKRQGVPDDTAKTWTEAMLKVTFPEVHKAMNDQSIQ